MFGSGGDGGVNEKHTEQASSVYSRLLRTAENKSNIAPSGLMRALRQEGMCNRCRVHKYKYIDIGSNAYRKA